MKLIGIAMRDRSFLKPQKFLLLWFVICAFTSCSLLVNTVVSIPNLNVYTDQEIDGMIEKFKNEKNVFDAKISYQPKSEQIKNLITKGMENRFYVYDSTFSIVCLNKKTYTCSSTMLNDIKNKSLSSQIVDCESPKVLQSNFEMNLNQFLNKLNLRNQGIQKDKSFTVVYFWNRDFSKGKYVENWNYFKSNFINEDDIQFIRISTDLNENWRLDTAKKLKMRLKSKGDGIYEIKYGKIPFK
jgi:hypothetical protein